MQTSLSGCTLFTNALFMACMFTTEKSTLQSYYFRLVSLFTMHTLSVRVLGHFGHRHFGLGRFGLDISATDISASENAEGGRFGHNHKFWVWDVCMHKCVMHFIIF